MQILLKGYQCLRCGHQWKPRKKTTPVKCPACDSSNWQQPRGGEEADGLEAEVFKQYEVSETQRPKVKRYFTLHPHLVKALLEVVPQLKGEFGQVRWYLELDQNPEGAYEELFLMIPVKVGPEQAFDLLRQFHEVWSSSLPKEVRQYLNFMVVPIDDAPL